MSRSTNEITRCRSVADLSFRELVVIWIQTLLGFSILKVEGDSQLSQCGITLSFMVLGLEIVYHKKATKEQPIQRIRKIGTRLVRSDVYTVITDRVSYNDVRGGTLNYNINLGSKYSSFFHLCCHLHPALTWCSITNTRVKYKSTKTNKKAYVYH